MSGNPRAGGAVANGLRDRFHGHRHLLFLVRLVRLAVRALTRCEVPTAGNGTVSEKRGEERWGRERVGSA